MTSLPRRLRKLELGLTDTSGLVPHSKEWLDHWEREFDRLFAGEAPGEFRGVPLAAVDAIIEAGAREEAMS